MNGHQRKPHFRSDGVLHATIDKQRFHLRRSATGDHLLWINGRQPPLMLDDTAADFVTFLIEAAWCYQQGDGDETARVMDHVVTAMLRKYRRPLGIGKGRVTRERISADLDTLFGTLMSIAKGACPAELGIDPGIIDYADWSAPARMDLAVTYRCNLKCEKCYLAQGGPMYELATDQWLRIYESLWRLGVPQVVFTGGEPTLRADLVQLISQADEFVTGLVTNGTRLAELAEALRDASLDYVQVTIESDSPDVHDRMTGCSGSHGKTVAGIRSALDAGLEVVTNTTLTGLNASCFPAMVLWLYEGLGVTNVCCNTLICSGRGIEYRQEHGVSDEELLPILQDACCVAEDIGANLQWYSPTCYTRLNPLDLGFGAKSCSAAAHNMTIQPDGTVLPCQSWPSSVGSMLTDTWRSIWEHPVCRRLRERQLASAECSGCIFVHQCGGGCPLDEIARIRTQAEVEE